VTVSLLHLCDCCLLHLCATNAQTAGYTLLNYQGSGAHVVCPFCQADGMMHCLTNSRVMLMMDQ
jgi:hypothetical protein